MKKPLKLFIVSMSIFLFSFATKSNPVKKAKIFQIISTTVSRVSVDHQGKASTLSNALYDSLSLGEKGLSKTALQTAIKGYLHLEEQGQLNNSGLLSIADFSQSSRKKRFYLLDMKNGQLLINTYVAHGKGSGMDMANVFSNIPGSEKSSLGFYLTQGTYTGKNGLSLRMEGLDKGFNDNAEKRAIVVHGADYVNAKKVKDAFMGRSQGCPALPRTEYVNVIDRIKDGSALFVYYPSSYYLNNSTVLTAKEDTLKG